MKHTFLIFIFSVFATMGWGQTLGKIKFSSGGSSSNQMSSSLGDIFIPLNNILTATEENIVKLSAQVFPNPSDDKINIKVNNSNPASRYKVKIIDILGKELLSTEFYGLTHEVSISQLSNGAYCLILYNVSNQKIFNQLIIKK